MMHSGYNTHRGMLTCLLALIPLASLACSRKTATGVLEKTSMSSQTRKIEYTLEIALDGGARVTLRGDDAQHAIDVIDEAMKAANMQGSLTSCRFELHRGWLGGWKVTRAFPSDSH